MTNHPRSPRQHWDATEFATLEEALTFSRSRWEKVWAKIPGKDGVYEIYPGGRNIFWPNKRISDAADVPKQ